MPSSPAVIFRVTNCIDKESLAFIPSFSELIFNLPFPVTTKSSCDKIAALSSLSSCPVVVIEEIPSSTIT